MNENAIIVSACTSDTNTVRGITRTVTTIDGVIGTLTLTTGIDDAREMRRFAKLWGRTPQAGARPHSRLLVQERKAGVEHLLTEAAWPMVPSFRGGRC